MTFKLQLAIGEDGIGTQALFSQRCSAAPETTFQNAASNSSKLLSGEQLASESYLAKTAKKNFRLCKEIKSIMRLLDMRNNIILATP